MRRKIIAVDFDGTLCEDRYPMIGKPKSKVIEYIKRLQKEEDVVVILWTCRSGLYLKKAVEWCKAQGIELDHVNENAPNLVKLFTNDCRKIFADIYLDDKAKTLEEIENGE